MRYALPSDINANLPVLEAVLADVAGRNVDQVFVRHSGCSSCRREKITADFVYVRLHGLQAIYASSYNDELDAWAGPQRSIPACR